MPSTVEDFVKNLVDSGLMQASVVESLQKELAINDPIDFARELVKRGHLTKYQASMIYQGKIKGLVLGNYVLLEKLGQGGMGMVFKARHCRMDRVVALKVLPPNAMNSVDAVKRFQREMQAAAKLNHPNIVVAHDADEAGKVHFLVMEYVEGRDLSQIVKEHGPLPVSQALDYILQAARGLNYAHGKGIIHRDIKPSNLLVDSAGVVKILDMGLARVDGSSMAAQGDLTHTGTVMGTPDFMAPEQAENTKAADQRSDIYSLGCALYYLLTGQVAYGGETIIQKILAHREQDIPDLSAIRQGIPPAVVSVFRRMVAKKPRDRYQSMSAVITDLEKCRQGANISGPAVASTTVRVPDEGITEVLPASTPPPAARKLQNQPIRIYVLIGSAVLGWMFLLCLGVGVLNAIIRPISPDGDTQEVPSASAKLNSTKHPPRLTKPHTPRVLLVIAHRGYYAQDYALVRRGLDTAGVEVVVASSSLGPAEPGRRPPGPLAQLGPRVSPNVLLESADAKEFDVAIFLGFDGDEYLGSASEAKVAKRLVQGMLQRGKVVAGLTTGPIVLAEAGVLKGRKATCLATLQAELEKAGAEYVRERVVVDGSIITAQNTNDAEGLVKAILEHLRSQQK